MMTEYWDELTTENGVDGHEIRADREDHHGESEGEKLDDDMAKQMLASRVSHFMPSRSHVQLRISICGL